ncbi:hypothetical protein L0P49_07250 [Enterocloster bolteae]|nr:hypothetical protein [Enterocloster bolteae]UOX72792.1 hypothetical protein K4205_14480 [Enterocloster bolteae]
MIAFGVLAVMIIGTKK